MRASCLLLFALAACSTVESRETKPPVFEQSSRKSLAELQGCIAQKASRQDVQYLPKANGATLSAGVTTGAAKFVTWVVDIDDGATARTVSVYATRPNSKLILPSVTACL